MSDNPLAQITEGFTKPVSKVAIALIDKIGSATGIFYEPIGTKREAKAKAKAAKIHAESEIEIAKRHRQAEYEAIEEASDWFRKQQRNIGGIIQKSLPYLNEDADVSSMDEDMLAFMVDKFRLVSDSEMQSLWAKILAGEANAHGSFSKRTVHIVSTLDKGDAEHFAALHQFCWMNGGSTIPIIFYFDKLPEFYVEHGFTNQILNHLEDIGIIEIYHGMLHRRALDFSSRDRDIFYFERKFTAPEDVSVLGTGPVSFTKAGGELVTLSEVDPLEGYYDYVIEYWEDEIRRAREQQN